MAEVPSGSSGIGSALFNSCRQIGTAMGLAILGSVAASVILAEWHRRAGSLPRPNGSRPHSSQLMSRAARLTWSPHPPGRTCSARRLRHSLAGFEAALLLAGVILAAAGVVGIRGLRHLQMPGSSQSR
jgi:hypothetical protein